MFFSSSSDESDSDDSEMFEEALGSPIGAQTLQLASEWIGKQRYSSMQDSDEDDFYDTSDDDGADTQTEGEELARAREIRRQEVKLKPLPHTIATDTETEVSFGFFLNYYFFLLVEEVFLKSCETN